MKPEKINLSRFTRIIIILSFFIAIIYLGQDIIVPLAFAMFFALLLYPVCRFFEKKLSRIFSIILTFVGVILLISGIVYFFGSQFYHVFENMKDFGEKISVLINKLIKLVDRAVFPSGINLDKIIENKSNNIMGSRQILEKTITTSTGIMASIILVFVYTFLFLLFRTSFKKFILYHFPSDKQSQTSELLMNIQKIVQNYFFGLFIIITILGTLNGVGLMVIGLDYPFLFGYCAAFLAIIPYIGTFIGGLLPFLYALVINDSLWTSVFVVLWYILIQALEGNILTPKIVGSKVSLNPLIALVALLTGGVIWGIAGMVLFIPIMAILKVVFDNVQSLKPYGLLLGSNFGNDDLPLLKRLSRKIEEKVDKND